MVQILDAGIIKWDGKFCGKQWTLFCGNALDCFKYLEDQTVNCIITSPPYYSLRDYGMPGQIGLEDSVSDYIDSICAVMKEAYRVLKKDGLLFLNLGDTYYSGKGQSKGIDVKSNKRRFGLRPVDKSGGLGIDIQRKSIIGIPWRIAIEMLNQKWILRTPIIWHRSDALPESVKDRPRRSFEYVFMFAKDRKYFFNRDPLVKKEYDEDVWTIKARPKHPKINTAPYPDELVFRCIEIGCPSNGIILDPFVGSGTTMRVALQCGMDAIGFELNKNFCEFITKEINGL